MFHSVKLKIKMSIFKATYAGDMKFNKELDVL